MQALVSFLNLGGPVVWILAVFSLAALTIVLAKGWQVWQLRAVPLAGADDAIDRYSHGEHARALLLVQGQRNPRARLVAQSLVLLDDGHLTLAEARDEAFRLARAALADLGAWIRPLDVIAVLSPLLGLFGTVLGMIEAFQAMEGAGAQVNPAVLSGGIWVALLTTAVGLAVAIPVSIAHSWFERRLEVQAAAMQDDIERLFTLAATRREQPAQVRKSA